MTNTTNGTLPSLPFVHMKNKILGKKYDLSVVVVGEKKIHALNKFYRKVDSPTDVLSFSIDTHSGEIFICQKIAKKKMKKFDRDYKNFLAFLVIHSMVHLLGFDHGNKMEKEEVKYRKYFTI